MRVATSLRERLHAALRPSLLQVVDESHLHAGHAGARPEGESHFRVVVASAAFAGRSRLERQRMVYAAVGELMTGDVHAFAITALTPEEAAARGLT